MHRVQKAWWLHTMSSFHLYLTLIITWPLIISSSIRTTGSLVVQEESLKNHLSETQRMALMKFLNPFPTIPTPGDTHVRSYPIFTLGGMDMDNKHTFNFQMTFISWITPSNSVIYKANSRLYCKTKTNSTPLLMSV